MLISFSEIHNCYDFSPKPAVFHTFTLANIPLKVPIVTVGSEKENELFLIFFFQVLVFNYLLFIETFALPVQ